MGQTVWEGDRKQKVARENMNVTAAIEDTGFPVGQRRPWTESHTRSAQWPAHGVTLANENLALSKLSP